MKYSFFLLYLFLSTVAFGQDRNKIASKLQNVDLTTNKLLEKLKVNKPDYIIVASRVIQGMQLADSIGFPSYRYIYWLKDSTTYFQEIRGYDNHAAIKGKVKSISKSGIFSFLKNNYDSIKDDSILPFIRKYNYNDVECYEVIHGVHRSFNTISIITPDGGIEKEFEAADLLDDYGPSMINLNSNHNKNSKLKMLWDLLWNEMIKDNR